MGHLQRLLQQAEFLLGLAILSQRNTCYTWLIRNGSTELYGFDEATYLDETDASNPETSSVRNVQKRLVRKLWKDSRLNFGR